jgi:hypothetical protein
MSVQVLSNSDVGLFCFLLLEASCEEYNVFDRIFGILSHTLGSRDAQDIIEMLRDRVEFIQQDN